MANPEQKSTKLKGVLPEHFVKSQTIQGKVRMLAEIFPDMSREISGATAKNFFEGMAGDQEAYDTFKSASRGDKGAIAKVAERLVGASNESNRQLAKIALDVIDSSSPAPAGRPRRRATRPADNSNGVPVSGNNRTTSESAASAPIAAEPAPVTPARSDEPAPTSEQQPQSTPSDDHRRKFYEDRKAAAGIPPEGANEITNRLPPITPDMADPRGPRRGEPSQRPGYGEFVPARNDEPAPANNDVFDPAKIAQQFSHVATQAYPAEQNASNLDTYADELDREWLASQRAADDDRLRRNHEAAVAAGAYGEFGRLDPSSAEFAPDFEASDERTEERRGFLRKALGFTGNAIAKASGFTGLALMSGVIFLGNRSEKGRQIVEAMTPEQRAKYQRRVSIGSNLLISAATLWTLATKTHAMDWMPGIGGSGSQGGNTPDSDRLVDATQGGPDKPAGPAATSEVSVPSRRKAFNGLFRGFNLSSDDDERDPATPGNANYLWENAVDTSTRAGKTRENDFNTSIPLAEAGNEDSVTAMLKELDAQFQGNTLELASYLGDARIEGAPWREHYDSQQDYTEALRNYATKLEGDEGLHRQQYERLVDKFSDPLTTYEKINNWDNYGSWLINHETGELEWDPDVEVKTVEDSEECRITFSDGTVIKPGHCGQNRVPKEYVLPEPVAPAAPVEYPQETDEPYYPAPQAPESLLEPEVPEEQEDEPAPEPAPEQPEQPLPPPPPAVEPPPVSPPPAVEPPPVAPTPKPSTLEPWRLPGDDESTDAGSGPQNPVGPGVLTSPIDVPTPGSHDTPGSTTGIKPETSSPGGSGITPGPAESAGSGAGAAATPDGQGGRATTPQ